MIPTIKKDRLPKNLAYPFSASRLSEALAGVPQFDSLSVSFQKQRQQLMKLDEWKKAGWPSAVVSVYYFAKWRGYHTRKDSDSQPEWSIFVGPISMEHLQNARKLICDVGLPSLRAWFLNPKTELWLSSSHHLDLLYSETRDELSVIESKV